MNELLSIVATDEGENAFQVSVEMDCSNNQFCQIIADAINIVSADDEDPELSVKLICHIITAFAKRKGARQTGNCTDGATREPDQEIAPMTIPTMLDIIDKHNATVAFIKSLDDIQIPVEAIMRLKPLAQKQGALGFAITHEARAMGIDAKCFMQSGEIIVRNVPEEEENPQ